MEDYIQNFNKKWYGVKVLHCDYLLSQMRLTSNKIFFSCNCISNIGAFPYFHEGKLNFSLKEYFDNLDILLTNNLNNIGVCAKCKYAKSEPVEELKPNNIELVTFDYYKNCNGNCIYCFAKKEKTAKSANEIKEFIKDLINKNMLKSDCLFRYGGGEPTLLNDFDELYSFINKMNYEQSICTSGILYSKTIETALKNGEQVIISPDSGTEKTFIKVKRTDKYCNIWNNIKEYAKFGKELYIKYVIFCLNSNLSEIDKFIEKCIECNVKNVIIDCELYSASGMFKYPAQITDKEINAAIHLKDLCIKNNIDYIFGNYWNDKHLKAIQSGIISE